MGEQVGEQIVEQIDEQGRTEPPLAADETATLLGFLDFQRQTLAWKCSGIDATGLAARLEPSGMTLGGILKHLAWVEHYWFGERMRGRAPGAPWDAVDWAADRDWEWRSAAHDTPDELRRLWQRSVEAARADVAAVLDAGTSGAGWLGAGGLDTRAATASRDGSAPSLRWVLVHMIEEYARHNGHADLLREAVDGLTGE